jgi:hypothetical protein
MVGLDKDKLKEKFIADVEKASNYQLLDSYRTYVNSKTSMELWALGVLRDEILKRMEGE